jgi:hypothetical protein
MLAALTLVGSTLAAAASAADAPAKIEPEVLKLREAAWRAWFAGDTDALGRMLPPEFIGLSMEGPLTGRERTLQESSGFHAGGGRLVRLEFPETQAQAYGDVVILYGRYRVVFESDGAEKAVSGRLTELFVRQGKTWIHTGWHLDTVAAP